MRSRLPYIARRQTTTGQLFELDQTIQTDIGIESFCIPYGQSGHLISHDLPQRFKEPWARFQGTVAEIVCETAVKQNGVLNGARLVSDEELITQLQKQAESDPLLKVEAYSFNFTYGDALYAVPDGMAILTQANSVLLNRFFEYKSRMEGLKAGQNKKSINTALIDAASRRPLQAALGALLRIDPESVVIPSSKLPVKLVIADASVGLDITGEDTNTFTEKFKKSLVVGLGNIRAVSFLVLRRMLERDLKPWEEEFIPIDQQLAQTIQTIRATKRRFNN